MQVNLILALKHLFFNRNCIHISLVWLVMENAIGGNSIIYPFIVLTFSYYLYQFNAKEKIKLGI